MNLQQFGRDEDAVSPVIGVILMVAITVILAAVIASFVLSIPSTLQTTPSADFAFDYDGGSDTLVVTHQGGEKLDAENVYVRGESFGQNGQGWLAISGSEVDSASRVVSGDSVRLTGVGPDYVVRIVYDEGDSTGTIKVARGPDA